MKKFALIFLLAGLSSTALLAGNQVDKQAAGEKKLATEVKNHFKFYGFVRNFFAYDSRESVAGTGDLFYYLPKDVNMNEDGLQDLNEQSSFRFLALTSRLGVDVYGYKLGRTTFGAKIETDFYAGLTNRINGTAQLRLRQAFMTIGWDDLAPELKGGASVTLKLGQAWHPIAAEQPHVLALETGTPFNPFSRTPQVLADVALGQHFILSAAAIWQMQYLSQGPSGASAEYIKYGCTPEFFLGLTYKTKGGFLAKAGLDVLSIKPRHQGKNAAGVTVKVSDRLTTLSPFIYLQYKKGLFELKARSVLSQAGEHINLMSGYGVSSSTASDGHWEYVPLNTSSTWASVSYGKKWQVMLMGGYIRNLGTFTPLQTDRTENGRDYVLASNVYFHGSGFSNLNALWRVVPTVAYNIGKFTVALECNITSAQYGDYSEFDGTDYLDAATGLASQNLHWVTNVRVQSMVRFTF